MEGEEGGGERDRVGEGVHWPDRLAGKATIASGMRLGRSEVLRILRHSLQSGGHRAKDMMASFFDRLEERGVGEKGR